MDKNEIFSTQEIVPTFDSDAKDIMVAGKKENKS